MLLGIVVVVVRGTVVPRVPVVAPATVDVTVGDDFAELLHAAVTATSKRINKKRPRRMSRRD
jgi:hypothetical protein